VSSVDGPVRVLAFAGARDAIGAGEISLTLDALREPTAAGVLDAVIARCPALEPHRRYLRLAINGAYVALDAPVRAGDEIAIIPPVAGG
jgi:molybdopterin converting factor small subunit